MNDPRNLFRQQALERKTRLDGAVIVRPPMGYRVNVAVSASMGLALLGFIVFGSYAKNTSLPGVILPDRGLSVVPAPDGVVETLYVTEGMRVAKGRRLALIANRRSAVTGEEAGTITVTELEHSLSLLREQALSETQLLSNELAALSIEADLIERDDASLSRQMRAADGRLDMTKQRLVGAKKLLQQQYLSSAALSEYEDHTLDAQARIDDLQLRHDKNRQQLHAITIKKRQAELRNNARLRELDRQESEIRQRLVEAQAKTGLLVSAPTAGTVTAIRYREGMQTASGTMLLTILPEGAKLQVELYVPSASIPYVREGDWVSLKYRAFPYQRFGMFRGHVNEVTSAMVSPHEAPPGLSLPNEPVFRVLVEPEAQEVILKGRKTPLQPGMLADVNILTQRRYIWIWMAEPFARRTATGI
ncbi:MAG: efflux RND transporter periplasmic adaptor subunit [Xanthomonadales bacterium]|nr:efflux RND transporter periplasmic adaptor subunit [Xanthomonadales bacterium]MDZ4117590.1 efflux RND transporter periplasmic adaptor subunit [Xanthomonadaceae bacterium]